jgi:hypothetical protein
MNVVLLQRFTQQTIVLVENLTGGVIEIQKVKQYRTLNDDYEFSAGGYMRTLPDNYVTAAGITNCLFITSQSLHDLGESLQSEVLLLGHNAISFFG